MQHDDLPLFTWRPPAKVIPFPSSFRVGHAMKIAMQLSKARSNREADHIISRAVQAHCRQMEQAGLSRHVISEQRIDFLVTVDFQCRCLNSRWHPEIPAATGNSDPRGAA